MNPIEEYWQQIESGAIVVGDKIKRTYRKLTTDLSDADSVWEYSSTRANHALDFIQRYCKHSKGAQGGEAFVLELWQLAMTAAVFGFVHKVDGVRKYREIILIVARKNGKSTWASAVALYMLFADGELGPEVVSAATKREQAKITWQESKRMIKKAPALCKRARTLVGEILTDFNDGSFKPLSSDSNSLDGLNVHCSLIDELHAITDKNLYDVIIDGMSAREQPLSIITSTAGTVRAGIFDIKYDEVVKIISGYTDGNYVDERTLAIVYELDNGDDYTDPVCWPKANPGLGTIKAVDQLAAKVEKAKTNPLLVSNLLCKDFNRRATVAEALLTFDQLNNEATFDLAVLKPRYGIGGVDLSITTDLTAAALIFKLPGDETIYCKHMYWLPEDLVDQREAIDRVPYRAWIKRGLMRTTPGNKIHYRFVTDWFVEMQNEHDVYLAYCGYDSYSATYFVEEMKKNFGTESVEPVIQGYKTLSSPLRTLIADLDAKRINYDNNPITKWCMGNVQVVKDRNDNWMPCKTSNQHSRIDGFAALLDAVVVLERHYDEYMNMI